MPSASATRQACWPPAPPKVVSAYSVTSWPRCTEMRLIASAMLPTAISRKPSASCSALISRPVAVRTSSAMAAKRARTAATSSGWSASGPNTLGKKSGWILPSRTLQSVTANGPPRR
ncbi:Uncharacterised protein [Bordetella pertussis]|nr:Uncharacterised protein [Bordetella pertussis]CFW09784.1 Uncharacterised protein [Bordetella pertussis]